MNGWEIKSLDQVGEVVGGGTPDTNNPKFWDGTFNWITPNDLNKLKTPYIYDSERKITKEGLTNSSAKSLPPNTLVLSTRAPIGYLGITTSEASTNQGCKSIVFKNQQDPLFFYYLLSLNVTSLINLGTGTTFSELSKKDLENFTLRFPKDKSEQTTIAQILSTVDKAIEQTEILIAKYQRIKTGLMQDLLTKGIDEHGNIRSEKTHKFKNSPLGKVPVEWEVVELGNYSFVTKLAGFEYTLHFDYSVGGEIIAIRGLNLKNGELDLTDIQTMPKATSEYLIRSKLFRGDLVISYVGTVGEMAVIEENNKYHLAPNVAKISVKKNYLNPWFLKEYLFSHSGKMEIINQSASTTQAALTMGNLRKIRIILPPLKEQVLIEKKLNDIDNTIVGGKRYLKKLHLLKSGFMQDLLTGKVSVY